MLLARSRPVSKRPQRRSATPPAPSDPKQTSATWSCSPASALMCTQTDPHRHVSAGPADNAHIRTPPPTPPSSPSLLEPVLVELVQLVPVGAEEGGALSDLLALQRPSPGRHLLPAGQRFPHWALQLVDAGLHLLLVVGGAEDTSRDLHRLYFTPSMKSCKRTQCLADVCV